MATRPLNPVEASRSATVVAVGDLLWKLSEIEATASDFSAGNQDLLEDRIGQYLDQLVSLQQLATPMADIKLPIDLIKRLDEGGDPNQYTLELFRAGVRDNQLSKGKVLAVQQLRDTLMAECDTAWPQHTAQYRALLSAPASSALPA